MPVTFSRSSRAGGVVLIPNAPLVLITLFVQVIAVTLLPAALVFLILLLNNEEIMGKYKNTTAAEYRRDNYCDCNYCSVDAVWHYNPLSGVDCMMDREEDSIW